jgi:hypothetical protein
MRSSIRTVRSGVGVVRRVPLGPTTGHDGEGSGSAWHASTTADLGQLLERCLVSTGIGETQVGPSCRRPETNVPARRRGGMPGGPEALNGPEDEPTWRSWSCSASASWASWPSCPCRSSVGPGGPRRPRCNRPAPLRATCERQPAVATPAMAGMTSRPMRSSWSRSSPFIRYTLNWSTPAAASSRSLAM